MKGPRLRTLLGAVATLVLLMAGLSVIASPASAAVSFPVRLSSNNRYLIDNAGNPFMIHGDTAWSIMGQLNDADVEYYLEDRRAKGFNAVLMNLLEHGFSNNPPNNVYGDKPFTTAGDFSTPNNAYFAHADTLLTKAAAKGILVFLAPAYVGNSNFDGWGAEIVANSATKNRNFGRYVGNRYKNFKNIIWVGWGDRLPAPGTTLETHSLEILKGIEDNAPAHLHIGHFKRNISAREVAAFKPHMDLDALYTAHRPYVMALRRYAVADPKPTFLYEAHYEGVYKNPGWPIGTPATQRRQAYWAMTSGATGHIYGNHGIWGFGWNGHPDPVNRGTWKEDLNDPGTLDMAHVKNLFNGKPWYNLVPDGSATVVTAGRGTKDTADNGVESGPGNDYVTAARTVDGKLVMAYIPPTGTTARTITVNMTKLSGTTTARWFNPNTGAYTTISGSPFPNTGSRNFTTPGNNGDNANDWVLVLEANAAAASEYQAENATISQGVVSTIQTGFTGTGYVNPNNVVGSYVQFAVTGPASTVKIRFANGDTVNRPMTLSIDGGAGSTVNFNGTGAWNTWTEVTVPVSLSAGSHTIRLTSSTTANPNLDRITLS